MCSPDLWNLCYPTPHVLWAPPGATASSLNTRRRQVRADAVDHEPQDQISARTPHESARRRRRFRPFAPAVLEEQTEDWFDLTQPSPYMLLVAPVAAKRLDAAAMRARQESGHIPEGQIRESDIREWVNERRSEIPAVTHVDGNAVSARVQTVSATRNPRLHEILKAFEARTGCGVIINTSFNVRGEPIVCTPSDAYRCFMRTEMDVLVLVTGQTTCGRFRGSRADEERTAEMA